VIERHVFLEDDDHMLDRRPGVGSGAAGAAGREKTRSGDETHRDYAGRDSEQHSDLPRDSHVVAPLFGKRFRERIPPPVDT